MRDAVLLAGGLGTRLGSVSRGLPKPLIEVGGRPFIEHVLDGPVNAGCSRIVVAASYKWKLLRDHLGASYRGCTLDWSIEAEPLGTGGAMRQAFENFGLRAAFVLNADTLFRVDLAAMEERHLKSGALVTVALRETADVTRFGKVSVGEDGRIKLFSEKAGSGPGLINGGIYLIGDHVWSDSVPLKAFSFERDFLQKRVATEQLYGFVAHGYFIDIGVPDDLDRARRELSPP
jgi:D-glycero-alpha-D-manno-heptose 1-phosphate guanylyltransferase